MTATALASTRLGSVDRPARSLRLVRDGHPTGVTRVIAGASGLLLKHSEPGQLVRAVRVLATGAAVLSLLPHPTR
jgi:DNA-binding NarL/FixJ family response regulator